MDAREKADLYNLDLSEVVWKSAPGSDPRNRIEVADLPRGAKALRNPSDPEGTVLRYTAAEWQAFVQGARDGEFDTR
ncbi:DUF397 domain-containing protein [Streptomyces sp. NRRL F-5053]|uniref:DUF397 domain-containing protein n=1 Tax=Streptomyces sp. NRRL F-5053 TaxID=1463854 RepID=UPI00099D01B4|nr:DUF397 domain-containing protein [Streptomyces sp. NRRL F-5053]